MNANRLAEKLKEILKKGGDLSVFLKKVDKDLKLQLAIKQDFEGKMAPLVHSDGSDFFFSFKEIEKSISLGDGRSFVAISQIVAVFKREKISDIKLIQKLLKLILDAYYVEMYKKNTLNSFDSEYANMLSGYIGGLPENIILYFAHELEWCFLEYSQGLTEESLEEKVMFKKDFLLFYILLANVKEIKGGDRKFSGLVPRYISDMFKKNIVNFYLDAVQEQIYELINKGKNGEIQTTFF